MRNVAACVGNINSVNMTSWWTGRQVSISSRHILPPTGAVWYIITNSEAVIMFTSCITSSCMIVFRQFPDRLLYCSTPTINRYIRLQVIVRIIRASVTNSYGMSMCTSLFGCFCALIRTPWSRSRFCTTCVVFFYKSKSMRVIPACTNRYIVVMCRKFSDRKIRKDDNLWNVFKYWTVRF